MKQVVVLEKTLDELSPIFEQFRSENESIDGLAKSLGLEISDSEARDLLLGTSAKDANTTYQFKMIQADPKINMTQVEANDIFSTLISIAGAAEADRFGFVRHFVENESPTSEWRFQGSLGFGGKFRYKNSYDYFSVDFYREDQTEKRNKIVNDVNAELMGLFAKHRLNIDDKAMSDEILIDYFESHSKTERRAFCGHHINRMIRLADYPFEVRSVEPAGFMSLEEKTCLQLVELARNNIKDKAA